MCGISFSRLLELWRLFRRSHSLELQLCWHFRSDAFNLTDAEIAPPVGEVARLARGARIDHVYLNGAMHSDSGNERLASMSYYCALNRGMTLR